jgi:hypothetical protein
MLSGIESVSYGGNTICAVATDSRLWCWGLTNPKPEDTFAALVRGAPNAEAWSGVTAVSVSATDEIYALKTDGTVWGWRRNARTSETVATSANTSEYPVMIDLPGRAVQVSAGAGFACAVLEDGSAHCWGINSLGKLGRGIALAEGEIAVFDDRPAPVVTADGKPLVDVQAVSAGNAFTCAMLKSDRSLWCWGTLGGESDDTWAFAQPRLVQLGATKGKPIVGVRYLVRDNANHFITQNGDRASRAFDEGAASWDISCKLEAPGEPVCVRARAGSCVEYR